MWWPKHVDRIDNELHALKQRLDRMEMDAEHFTKISVTDVDGKDVVCSVAEVGKALIEHFGLSLSYRPGCKGRVVIKQKGESHGEATQGKAVSGP